MQYATDSLTLVRLKVLGLFADHMGIGDYSVAT